MTRRLVESRYNLWDVVGGDHYVFNGVSGGMLRLAADQRRAVDALVAGDDSSPVDAGLLLNLIRGRMLVEAGTDELDLLRRRYKATASAPESLGLTIVTSLGCNFACPYCFEDKPSARLRSDVADAIAGLVDRRGPELRTLRVTWFGGEPLVARRELHALGTAFVELAQRHDFDYSADVITNGYLLDAATCEMLAAQHVETVQIGIDGPREVHDCYRPLRSGRGTFDRVLANIVRAADFFDVTVRVNVDRHNVERAREVIDSLAAEGLEEKVRVYVGHLVALTTNPLAPSATFGADRCLPMADYASAASAFDQRAASRGFATPSMPTPRGAPCTAVRDGEWVIGPAGELWKCWDNVGDRAQIVGSVFDLAQADSAHTPYGAYDPFSDAECRECIALPVCMGGCAHHALEPGQRANRCGTFRFEHRAQMRAFIEHARTTQPQVLPMAGADG